MNRVAILLSTYNGERFIHELLESLAGQTYQEFDLIIRDDGSSDRTLEIVDDFIKQNRINIIIIDSNGGHRTPELSLSFSFFKILNYANDILHYSYFLFCDQDDVWHKNKVERMVDAIKSEEIRRPDFPILVHSDLRLVDSNGNHMCSSFWKWQHINPLRNSTSRLLIQNTVTGCATIINRSLSEKLKMSPNLYYHDYRAALVASLIGVVVPLHEQLIDYRQHGDNVSGAGVKNTGVVANTIYILLRLLHMLFNRLGLFFKRGCGVIKSTITPLKNQDSTFNYKVDQKNKSNTLIDRMEKIENIIQYSIIESEELLSIYGGEMNDQSKEALVTLATLREKGPLQRKWSLLVGNFLPNSFYRAIGLLIVV